MFSFDCHITSPICISGKYNTFMVPIIYSGKLYIIREKNLQQILIKIGYIKEFIQYVRIHGYSSVKKWMLSKNLINKNLLESIAQYVIEDVNLKKVTPFNYFLKEENVPTLNNEFWQTTFKKCILYSYLSNKKDEFNEFVSSELDNIESKLSIFGIPNKFTPKKCNLKSNIFSIILNYYESRLYDHLNPIYQKVQDLNININAEFDVNSLTVQKVASLLKYQNFKLNFSEISYFECIKENTTVNLEISSLGRFVYFDFVEYLFHNLEKLTNDKIRFDINYITELCNFSNYNPQWNKLSSNFTLKDAFHNEYFESKNIVTLSENDFYVANGFKISDLQQDFILNKYNSIANSNLILTSPEELDKIICILNLDEENIARINKLFFNQSSGCKSEIMKLCLKDKKFIQSAFGYASLTI